MKNLFAKYQSFKNGLGEKGKWWLLTPQGHFLMDPIVVILAFVVLALFVFGVITSFELVSALVFLFFILYAIYYAYYRKEKTNL